jgi:serine/threonine-protein kinase
VAISSNGGLVRELTALDPGKHERSHRWPVFLPGGREVAFTIGTTDRPGDYEDSAIDAVVLASGERRALLTGASMVRCAGPDVLVLGREGQLFALPFRDGAASSLAGAVPVLQGVAGVPASGVVYFDVAADGTLVYSERNPHDVEFELAWLSRTGAVEPLPLPVREYRMPRLSPDGKRIAVGIGPARGRSSDIWIADIGGGALTRLTFDSRSAYPAWSPDGKRVAFGTAGSGKDTLSWKAADGSDAAEVLFTFEQSVPRAPDCWTPDGENLIFTQDAGPGRSSDLFIWSRADGVRELASSPSLDGGSQLSPDGRWLAYGSDQSGSQEIYVRALRGSTGRWQVSDVGESVRWSPDGRELYYTQGTRMFAVAVQGDAAAGTFTYGTPQLLFEQDFQPTCETQTNFDVGPDGRFLVVRSTSEESMAGHVVVVLDWDMELRAALARR